MPDKLLQIKPYTDFLIEFTNQVLGLFMVEGLSPEFQQVVKVFSMGILLVVFLALMSFFLRFIASVLEPWSESLARKPEYVLYVTFAFLILLLTESATFHAAVISLLLFAGLDLAAKYYLKIPLLPDNPAIAAGPDDEDEPDRSERENALKKKPAADDRPAAGPKAPSAQKNK